MINMGTIPEANKLALSLAARLDESNTATILLGPDHFPALRTLLAEYLRLLRFEARHKAGARKGGKVKSEAKAQAARVNASRPRPGRRKPKPTE